MSENRELYCIISLISIYMFDDDTCYQALLANDTRFDGLFFVGISTTGIYCRSICPARIAKKSSCTFFPTAAAAEESGYRPCLRCRPELAPAISPFEDRVSAISGAIVRIQAGYLNDNGSVDDLAEEYGISARHLRRLVKEITGVSPIEIAQTSRLLLAKQLLTETKLSITRVAFASGFSSLRRFNEAFMSSYKMSPSHFRKQTDVVVKNPTITLKLSYRPPFAWKQLLAFLQKRAISNVEFITCDKYLRTVEIDGVTGWLEVRHSEETDTLTVEVSSSLVPVLQPILSRLRTLFDLYARPDIIDSHLSASTHLTKNITACSGLRVPGTFNGFELAWRAILGQQVSVAGASTLAARFAEEFGQVIETPHAELNRLTPTPQKVADAPVSTIAGIGIPSKRAAAIQYLAALCVEYPSLLHTGASVETASKLLLELPGIGPWTVEYIMMRALHWPDAFPETDLGIRHAMSERSVRSIKEAAKEWQPWRAYAAMHMWIELGED